MLPRARAVDGAGLLRLLAVTGIVTVLGIRCYLARAGYPQIAGGAFHIAHALWGGLLLLVGLVTTLLFVSARRLAAVVGGVGLGLFIDEVGKLVSKQADYFFPLAPALMYLLFAALLVWSALWDRERVQGTEAVRGQDDSREDGTASAAQIAVEAIGAGLTADRRLAAEELLAGRDDRAARAVRELLDCAPGAPPDPWHRTAWRRLVARARAVAGRPRVQDIVFGIFLLSRVAVPISVLVRLIVLLASGQLRADQGALGELGALLGSLAGGLVSAVFAIHAARLWRRLPRDSYRWFKASALVDLLVVAVFNFAGNQWTALVFLPVSLAAWALSSWTLRDPAVPDHPRGLLPALLARLGPPARGLREWLVRRVRRLPHLFGLRLRRVGLGSRGDRTHIPPVPARSWRPGRLRRRGRRLGRRPRRGSRRADQHRPRPRAFAAHLPRRKPGRLDGGARPGS